MRLQDRLHEMVTHHLEAVQVGSENLSVNRVEGLMQTNNWLEMVKVFLLSILTVAVIAILLSKQVAPPQSSGRYEMHTVSGSRAVFMLDTDTGTLYISRGGDWEVRTPSLDR
jgi:hypothetical protein